MAEKVDLREKKWFTRHLMDWDSTENHRKMPWKGEKNPYRVWMSEIILQQTRVEQGTAYYERFIHQFPDPTALAAAPEEKVFKLWEGLGYYSRCKNLIRAAKEIQLKHQGRFPADYPSILALPGIGPYTAAAIASFAFGLPHAVLDGNVFRVLARFFGIDEPIDSTNGKKLFTSLSDSLLDASEPGRYNQAIMDLGATICKPRQPLCEACPLAKRCVARLEGRVNELPQKSKRLIKKTRWFNFLVYQSAGKVWVEKRASGDIWENLYQFPLVESEKIPALKNWDLPGIGRDVKQKPELIAELSQQLTHQTIHGRFFMVKEGVTPMAISGKWVRVSQLEKLAFPRMITRLLPKLLTYLS